MSFVFRARAGLSGPQRHRRPVDRGRFRRSAQRLCLPRLSGPGRALPSAASRKPAPGWVRRPRPFRPVKARADARPVCSPPKCGNDTDPRTRQVPCWSCDWRRRGWIGKCAEQRRDGDRPLNGRPPRICVVTAANRRVLAAEETPTHHQTGGERPGRHEVLSIRRRWCAAGRS
jgi:hypothetical protein